MSYEAFNDMPLWTRVRATKDITEKNRTMKAGETGVIVGHSLYMVDVRPDGKSLSIGTGDEAALALEPESR